MKKQRKVTYKARKNTPFSDSDAKIIGSHIENLIITNGGEVTPDMLLQDASSPTSQLHKYFLWDDDAAAHKFRLQQARTMLGSIVQVVVVSGKRSEERSFFNVTTEKKKSVYVTMETAITHRPYTVQLVEDAEGRIESLLSVLRLLKKNLK